MKILCVDISLIFSMMREANEGREDSEAFNRTIANVTSARAGFDRCMLAIDSGPSFRKVCAEYKANRKPRDAAYHDQLRRVIERLTADGCVPVVAPKIGTFATGHLTGADSFAEADDVIGWAAKQFELHIDDMPGAEKAGWHFAILSDDGDMEQLICDAVNVYVIKSALRGGEVWNEARVLKENGVPPEKIADLKALMGDKSDNYKGYTGPKKDIDPAKPDVDPGFNPGVGVGNAVALVNRYGSALGVFDVVPPEELAARWEADGVKPGIRATLARHGRGVAERGLFLATIHRDLPGLDFSVVLAEPTVKKIAEPRTYDDGTDLLENAPPPKQEATESASEPVAPSAQNAPSGLAIRMPAAITVQASNFDTLALQPNDPRALWKLAEVLFNSRVYTQFPNVESVFACIFEARERGVSAGVALRNAYIVKGKLAWSAAFMVGLVKDSGLARVFRIIETTSEKAVLEYQHKNDDAPQLFVFTIAEARNAGWLKSGANGDGKWITNPRSMLRWAAMRECVRFAWPEVVAGIYTPDELRNGQTQEGEYPEESDAA